MSISLEDLYPILFITTTMSQIVESHVDRNGATWYNRRDIGKSFSIAIVGQVVRL
jgi:hypothetical protein